MRFHENGVPREVQDSQVSFEKLDYSTAAFLGGIRPCSSCCRSSFFAFLFEKDARHDVGAGGRGSCETGVSVEGLVRRLMLSEECESGLCVRRSADCVQPGLVFPCFFCVFRTVVVLVVREAEDVSRCVGCGGVLVVLWTRLLSGSAHGCCLLPQGKCRAVGSAGS